MKAPTDKDWIILRLARLMVNSTDRTLRHSPDFTKSMMYLLATLGDAALLENGPANVIDALKAEQEFINRTLTENKELKAEVERLRARINVAIEELT